MTFVENLMALLFMLMPALAILGIGAWLCDRLDKMPKTKRPLNPPPDAQIVDPVARRRR